jgi:hypothetical protein
MNLAKTVNSLNLDLSCRNSDMLKQILPKLTTDFIQPEENRHSYENQEDCDNHEHGQKQDE